MCHICLFTPVFLFLIPRVAAIIKPFSDKAKYFQTVVTFTISYQMHVLIVMGAHSEKKHKFFWGVDKVSNAAAVFFKLASDKQALVFISASRRFPCPPANYLIFLQRYPTCADGRIDIKRKHFWTFRTIRIISFAGFWVVFLSAKVTLRYLCDAYTLYSRNIHNRWPIWFNFYPSIDE